ncbi:hypothetical protein HNQ71_002112 [Mesorhizobium sangaii]|uniref:Energy transducer TonB n=1 Tax=Mesorhizobium sangaii TaxID=505389 RepID=A0A841P2G1_9HYPH|nr:hypothetical protein [Mesorhizobium sangaii]
MTQAATLPAVELPRFSRRDLGLWAGAAALVLGAHVAIAYAVQTFSMVDEADGGPPPAQVIEMAPMVVMPAVEEQVAALDAVTPDQTEPTPEDPVEKAQPVVQQPHVVPPDETEPTQTEVAEQVGQPSPDEVVPDIVEAVAPDVVIPLPQPKPVEAPSDKKAGEAKAKRPVDKPKPRPKKEKVAPPNTASIASADAKPAARTAAPKSAESASRSGDSSKWGLPPGGLDQAAHALSQFSEGSRRGRQAVCRLHGRLVRPGPVCQAHPVLRGCRSGPCGARRAARRHRAGTATGTWRAPKPHGTVRVQPAQLGAIGCRLCGQDAIKAAMAAASDGLPLMMLATSVSDCSNQ